MGFAMPSDSIFVLRAELAPSGLCLGLLVGLDRRTCLLCLLDLPNKRRDFPSVVLTGQIYVCWMPVRELQRFLAEKRTLDRRLNIARKSSAPMEFSGLTC